MANNSGKLYLIILIFTLFCGQKAYAQDNKISLKTADLLFQQRKYVESFKLYQQVLEQQQHYSPQMLLKMAYIQESFKNYTGTIYYLHLYYDKKPSRTVLKKIEDLAQRQQYFGYEYSDFAFFQTQLNKYYQNILQVLLMVAVISVVIIFLNWRKQKLPTFGYRLGFILYLVFVLYYINFLSFGKQGIIQQNNVAIMSAPTAASSWIATATEGHKITLKGESDIWYETEWQGKTAYIRKKNVLELP